MRVLVCGGRDYSDVSELYSVMDALPRDGLVIINGGARGADRIAHNWAQDRGVETIVFPADWKRYGRSAGPLRNQRMLDEGKPDCVMAFRGGRGTADMVRRAKAAGVPVSKVEDEI